jgi:phosphatidylethanolamine/phosphatidyl-N-methylethanolamine N-methyltransferase
MKMTNAWNKFIYRLWAPIYDGTVNKIFLPGRRRAIQLLDLKPGERVLLVGVGTGADLPLLPEGVEAVGVDISPEMLSKARARLPLPGRSITLDEGDAHQFTGKPASFDAVIFNLILSVIPDGRRCLQENLNALKPQGRAVVFDKFAPASGRISFFRRFLNLFSTFFGTEITRRFGDILEGCGAQVVHQEASILRGNYRIFLLEMQGKGK